MWQPAHNFLTCFHKNLTSRVNLHIQICRSAQISEGAHPGSLAPPELAALFLLCSLKYIPGLCNEPLPWHLIYKPRASINDLDTKSEYFQHKEKHYCIKYDGQTPMPKYICCNWVRHIKWQDVSGGAVTEWLAIVDQCRQHLSSGKPYTFSTAVTTHKPDLVQFKPRNAIAKSLYVRRCLFCNTMGLHNSSKRQVNETSKSKSMAGQALPTIIIQSKNKNIMLWVMAWPS